MLSGNGRHRRPRQAPALIVAAGVTGSAIAIPLFAATGASAASTATWDKLAECESGGQWSLDAGNGYYGGLQFSQEMWEQYGGLDYAPRADEASRSQQIAVAEKVLDDRGIAAWPSCSVVAGLTKGDDSADVDPGASASPQPSGSGGSADDAAGTSGEKNHDESGASDSASGSPSDDPSGSASGSASDDPSADASGDTSGNKGGDRAGGEASDDASGGSADPKSDNSDKSGQSAADSPADPQSSDSATPAPSASGDASGDATGGGRHRGGQAADETPDSRTGEGRHASRDDERAGEAYTVRSGDNLWDIADAQDVHGGWAALYDLNKKAVGSDPDLILPGQSLDLGAETGEK
ncbi:LysM peptidoglycan-binding domain-containing protein [Streptomyces sp. SID14478]|uniref:LysM peptidoglycan-binding domain-containing protein n=1 Tax=Streptomyces sp. SID14478 TaxID=2706073 RepID=UPI0013DF929F|nr:transglycosylase family protein [Streptomyces sp. SID14478]NEB80634.1 LysM peptidoglycan-binding domain-containing protein [Streptomyces sp. SID14478]